MKLTKKRRKEMAIEIIDRNVLDVPFNEQDVYEFATVCQHDMDGVIRRVNPQFGNDPRHLHMLIEGDWKAWSWNKMIYPISKEQEVKRVMRHAVWQDMQEYRHSVDEAFCEDCFTSDDLTVDHMGTPFDEIANQFISVVGLPEIVDPPAGQVVKMFKCINTEAGWIASHAALANYQILCRSCNASKGVR